MDSLGLVLSVDSVQAPEKNCSLPGHRSSITIKLDYFSRKLTWVFQIRDRDFTEKSRFTGNLLQANLLIMKDLP